MTRHPITVRFGGQSVDREIAQFVSLDEARAVIGSADLLALINRAYRLRQLTLFRQELERHPRNSIHEP
jgi:hypothetical protein